jgi:hypothetical protein
MCDRISPVTGCSTSERMRLIQDTSSHSEGFGVFVMTFRR